MPLFVTLSWTEDLVTVPRRTAAVVGGHNHPPQLPLEKSTPKNQQPSHLGLARLELGFDQDDEVAVGAEDVGHRIQHLGDCGSDEVFR